MAADSEEPTRPRPPRDGETRVRAGSIMADTMIRPDETRVRPSASHPVAAADTLVSGVTRVREAFAPGQPPVEVAFGKGYRLRERYELDEMIGQGAMGQVWRAKDLLSEEARDRNPFVAVKVLNSDFQSRPDAFIALHREATRAQKL